MISLQVPPNRIARAFAARPTGGLLSCYVTAGFPAPDATVPVLAALAAAGTDILEIGVPFSDPVADGPVIQAANGQALAQGMSLTRLFAQLAEVRRAVPDTPLLLMGYLNPVLQFGFEAFCAAAADVGIDGLILPDLPPAEVEARYAPILRAHGLRMVYLITPRTPPARIQYLDGLTDDAFLYVVSGAGTTGYHADAATLAAQAAFMATLPALNLRNPCLLGFGIRDAATFRAACALADGAIIGSALVQALADAPPADAPAVAAGFVRQVRSNDR